MRPNLRWILAGLLFVANVAAQTLDVMFVLETSPGTEQAIGLIRPRHLSGDDRAGVIGFTTSPQVYQPLTGDRDALGDALRKAGTRITVGFGGGGIAVTGPTNVGESIRAACSEFDAGSNRRVVILFFGSEDPAISAKLDSLKSVLSAAKARLYAVAVQRVAEPRFPARPAIGQYPFPAITTQIVTQLVESSGGKIFKGGWDLKDILALARK